MASFTTLLTALVARRRSAKLVPKFYGPSKVLEQVGKVTHRLELPPDSRSHDVFHVSLLKEFKGEVPTTTPALSPLLEGKVVPTPQAILCSRLNHDHSEVLVQWSCVSPTDATWETVEEFLRAYQNSSLRSSSVSRRGVMMQTPLWEKHIQTQKGSKGNQDGLCSSCWRKDRNLLQPLRDMLRH